MATPTPPQTQAGLTLLECIVAIVVIGIMGLSVGPALILTAASRVQNQRADQALALAQLEVDRARVVMERGSVNPANLPMSTPTTNIRNVAAPTTFVASTAYSNPVTQARLVDLNGDGQSNFAVQVFRDPGVIPAGASTPISFQMGVRVYDIAAQQNLPTPGLLSTQATIGVTDRVGSRSRSPLVTLYTNVLRGDATNSLCVYASSLANGASTGLNCD